MIPEDLMLLWSMKRHAMNKERKKNIKQKLKNWLNGTDLLKIKQRDKTEMTHNGDIYN